MEQHLSRRERERSMRRQAMLEAARAVFAEKGYADATIDEVAQRAEFGKGTLYNYFEGGKEEILFALFDDLYETFGQLVEDAFAPDRTGHRPFREVFRDFVRDCLAFFAERRDQFLLIVKESQRMMLSEDGSKAAYFQHQMERTAGLLVPHLEAAMARGELRRLPALPIAHIIFANIKGCHLHMVLPACGGEASFEPFSPERAADFITTLMLDGLLVRESILSPMP